jgi:Arc/MetJ-type ribon-helix-helix transcriptional regulator
MKKRARLSASVDAELIHAAERAVADGTADTVSAWVNDALRLKLEHDSRLAAMAAFIAAYEEQHGAIDTGEMRQAARRARQRARPVRGAGPRERPSSRRRGRA